MALNIGGPKFKPGNTKTKGQSGGGGQPYVHLTYCACVCVCLCEHIHIDSVWLQTSIAESVLFLSTTVIFSDDVFVVGAVGAVGAVAAAVVPRGSLRSPDARAGWVGEPSVCQVGGWLVEKCILPIGQGESSVLHCDWNRGKCENQADDK